MTACFPSNDPSLNSQPIVFATLTPSMSPTSTPPLPSTVVLLESIPSTPTAKQTEANPAEDLTPVVPPTPTLPPASPTPSESNTLTEEMFAAINAERAKLGLSSYQMDEPLTTLAQAHAEDMATRGYFDHTTPEGVTYQDRLAAIGLAPVWRGENIILTVTVTEEAVADSITRWMSSKPHRDNILHSELSHIGVGVAQTPEGWYVFVANFIRYQ